MIIHVGMVDPARKRFAGGVRSKSMQVWRSFAGARVLSRRVFFSVS